jgi:hypothetical protein
MFGAFPVSEEGSDMTDGAGYVNKSGLRLLYHRFDWDTWPTAIQCRVGGSKVDVVIQFLGLSLTLHRECLFTTLMTHTKILVFGSGPRK